MTTFPENIKFKYNWRKYQQRVLDELEEHLVNNHLHIIAPPGSGKTVLGLEVALRLNQPVLILAPTLAIKYQWIQRFCELFIGTKNTPEWISTDIRNPKFFTVATYQGLHAACNNLKESEDEDLDEEESGPLENTNNQRRNTQLQEIIIALKKQRVATFILDEAHHLKNEWWFTLSKIKEQLSPVIVGLTATPPYDVSFAEWQRYIELNGPVDAEISVPELIAAGDLCPHQDYVYFTLPTMEEYESIVRYREKIEGLFDELKNDQSLVHAFENHPAWQSPLENTDWIYNNISYYSALLIYLQANNREIPKSHIELIGNKDLQLPKLDYPWMETSLEFYLHGEPAFKIYQEHQHRIENKLKRNGALTRKTISFNSANRVASLLTSSASKLMAIPEIVKFEYEQLGRGLRLVILSDYIRKEFFTSKSENDFELNKLGVIPIFETLRRSNSNNIKLGVLTGSIVIIPKTARDAIQRKYENYGIRKISISDVPFDNNYLELNVTETAGQNIVQIITQIFQEGEIEVLIGTKSLLGEGWDAPAINSLILGSVVGSFVLSNQMRGRAIRTYSGDPEKTANIWHLACIDPTVQSGGDDFQLLKRRFRTFSGISLSPEGGIENGTDRLNIPRNISSENIVIKNNETLKNAAERSNLRSQWNTAIANGSRIVEELKIPFPEKKNYKKEKKLYYSKTITYLSTALGSGLMAFILNWLEILLRNLKSIRSLQDIYRFFIIMGVVGFVTFGGLAFKTFRLYIRYRDIAKDINNIANALLVSLVKAGAINTDIEALSVVAEKDETGSIFCRLDGGTTYEKSVFINALIEIINPLNNPRYLIIRKSMLLYLIRQKDYHAVPEVIGRKKNLAEYFTGQWRLLVGNCELVFTRNQEGRKKLLRSRINSLSAQIDKNVQQVSKWR